MGEEQFRVEARVEGRVEGKSRFLPWLLVFIVAVAALLIPLLIFNGAPVLAGERAARANALDIAKSFFLLAASAGVGSMILVQTAKHLLRLRGWFNWMQVGRRFSTQGAQELLRGLGEPAAQKVLRSGSPRGPVGRVFDLPVELSRELPIAETSCC